MKILHLLLITISFSAMAQSGDNNIDKMSEAMEDKMIETRRAFHQYPELSNREVETGKKIAERLKAMGIEVQAGVAKTGVVGILRGAHKGPVVALRADIDGLPVTERTPVPYASKETTTFNGQNTGIMHACGHDTHIAILLTTAEILSKMKNELHGTVKFIFQPAEEGPPPGERGGASLMVEEGVLDNPKVDAIFGLHIAAGSPLGQISYKSAGLMAAADRFEVNIKGKQAHGSTPWASVDPVAVATQIINGFQYIISRNAELTKEGAVISVGHINAGVRYNIIPETARFTGTIRTLDKGMQEMIHEKMRLTAKNIADIAGAEVEIDIVNNAPITYNDPNLMDEMLPSLKKSSDNVKEVKAVTAAEDFSFFQEKVPGVYFFIGAKAADVDTDITFYSHHTPDFKIDESGMITGLKAMLNLTLDYLNNHK